VTLFAAHHADWPTYEARGKVGALSVEQAAAATERTFSDAPELAYVSTSVGAVDASASNLFGLIADVSVRVAFRAPPEMEAEAAMARGVALLEKSLPGLTARARLLAAGIATDVVAPTATQAAAAVGDTAAAVRSAVPWVTVALVAVVALQLLPLFRFRR